MSLQISCPKCGKVNKGKHSYCVNCGFQIKGNNEVDFQIVENLKTSLIGSLICISIFVAFMMLVTVAIIFEYGLFGYISILVIWPITIGFLIWASYYLKGLSKLRRFTITKDNIEITVPHKPAFQIKWSEFDAISITKRESMAAVPTGEGVILGPRFVYFNLIFKGKDVERSFEFESGKDFKVRTKKKIIIALEKYTKEKGKDFTGWKLKDRKRAKK